MCDNSAALGASEGRGGIDAAPIRALPGRRLMSEQSEFLFADGAPPELHHAHPLGDFFEAVAEKWSLPIGKAVRIALRDPALPLLEGKLELERAPDLPLNPREPLALRVRGLNFRSVDIASWSLAE